MTTLTLSTSPENRHLLQAPADRPTIVRSLIEHMRAAVHSLSSAKETTFSWPADVPRKYPHVLAKQLIQDTVLRATDPTHVIGAIPAGTTVTVRTKEGLIPVSGGEVPVETEIDGRMVQGWMSTDAFRPPLSKLEPRRIGGDV